jgi:two-component system CheB/CheR fusion protein
MLIFSEQNVIRDPPFSKLDLISCRNLMIYLDAALQKKLIPLFHYALNPGGMLFLGTSEGVGEFEALFTVLDRKAKLYQRKEDVPSLRTAKHLFLPSVTTTAATRRSETKTAFPKKQPLRELTEHMLLQQVIAAGALVNRHGDVLYLHGRTGMFLEPAPGEAGINNILKMAREGLRPDLTVTLHKAAGTNDTVHCPGVRVKTNGHFTRVNLTVRPVTTGAGASPESPLFLVIIEEASASAEATAGQAGPGAEGPDTDARIAALTQELRAKEEYLQSANEELESSAEELKSSNEEMQSVNEELQSTNEELETSKEELQSVNEELSTVNTELQNKVLDLSRANNDMNNLLAGTGIGTIFVDHHLRIIRFTPAAAPIINLISGDLGRPIAHFVSNLVGYSSLVTDVKAVLDTLAPKEVDVQVAGGKWYAMRIQPYRTLDNVIEGAVITFAEITEIVQARETLRRLTVVVRDAHDAITVQDLEGRIIAWNPGAVRMYGWNEAEALTMNVRDRTPESHRKDALAKLIQLGQAEILEPYRTQRLTKLGKIVNVSIISTALLDETGKMYAVSTTERKISGGEK